ncbi:MAG: biotin--[acetyl-CoA-carboxylase] ligase [Elusimicrobiota bacterium]|jgi:BirA family biotin operon repressor/biotin-[acetyl-CoA-carboxylase] ligase|nr:biotin--[acetyl-CoA-carboxylase] ligase [Elusimicrobiota bacterium]
MDGIANFDKTRFLARIKGYGIKAQVFLYKKIISTQTKGKKEAEKGAKERTIIIASRQSGGYGTRQKFWLSQKGGLWLSFILKPQIKAEKAQFLQFLLCLAMRRALNKAFLKQLKTKFEIKPPNDILYKGKKICGILVETSIVGDIIKWAVCGIGINVNNVLPKEMQESAISLKEILKKEIDLSDLATAFFIEFFKIYGVFLKGGKSAELKLKNWQL